MKHLILIIVICFIALKCYASDNDINNKNISKIYNIAKKSLYQCHYKEAIKKLTKIDHLFPINIYTQQIQLDLIYAYYKLGHLSKAQSSIDYFLRFYPNHPNIDYVIYMYGIINMIFDDNILYRFLNIDHSDRNPEHAYVAFYFFKKLIHEHSNSLYIADSRQRLIYLKNRLANYELHIVKYYIKQKSYVAAINRIIQMLINFQDTQATYHALFYMQKAYQKLHMYVQANQVEKIINMNELNY